MTTAQSFPLTPTDVMLAAVIALNAYSRNVRNPDITRSVCMLRTDLVQATLVREDGDMSVISSAAYGR